jgi:hypothetical protein
MSGRGNRVSRGGGHHGGASTRGSVYRQAFGSLMDHGAIVTPVPSVFAGNVVGGVFTHETVYRGGRLHRSSRWTLFPRARSANGNRGYAPGWGSGGRPAVNFRRGRNTGSAATRNYYDRRERVAVEASLSGREYPFPVATRSVTDDVQYPHHVDVFCSDGKKYKVPDLDSFGPNEGVFRVLGPVGINGRVSGRGNLRRSSVEDYFHHVSSAAVTSGVLYPTPVSCHSMGSDIGYPGHINVYMSDATLYCLPDLDEFDSADPLPPSLGPVRVTWGTANDPHMLD